MTLESNVLGSMLMSLRKIVPLAYDRDLAFTRILGYVLLV
jgi:hypothetical protein